jgi:hypothetical protein
MSQIQPSWTIYQNVQNNYKTKYEALPRETRILISVFVYQLSCMDEPELFSGVFACHEEGGCGFRIGNTRILFRPERIAQGFDDLEVLHMIDILID